MTNVNRKDDPQLDLTKLEILMADMAKAMAEIDFEDVPPSKKNMKKEYKKFVIEKSKNK